MVVKLILDFIAFKIGLRVVLSHMVVKRCEKISHNINSLRVVLSHMVVKQQVRLEDDWCSLRVVLSHMVVKR